MNRPHPKNLPLVRLGSPDNRVTAALVADDIATYDPPLARRLRGFIALAAVAPIKERLDLATMWRDGCALPAETQEQLPGIRRRRLCDSEFLRAFVLGYREMSLAEAPPDEDFDRIEQIVETLREVERLDLR